jgi:hypothetical protein
VEYPFSNSDGEEIKAVAEWIFKGEEYEIEDELPDGICPGELIQKWAPWIVEMVRFMDGDGAVRHWKYSTIYADEPAIDQEIYAIARARWIELKNEKLKAEMST